MSANPYVTADPAELAASMETPAPSPAPAQASSEPKKRKTNWMTITFALNGLAVGMLSSDLQSPPPASSYEFGEAVGEVLGGGIFCMLACGGIGLLLSRVFPRWLRIVCVAFAGLSAVGIGAVTAAILGLVFIVRVDPSEVSAAVPFERITASLENAEGVDWNRHREQGRSVVASHPLSAVFPSPWEREERLVSNDQITYSYSTSSGPQALFQLCAFPGAGSVDIDHIVGELTGGMRDCVTLETGQFTIDDQPAIYVAAKGKANGVPLRMTIYSVSRGETAYVAFVSWQGAMSKSARTAVEDTVNSIRIH